jgi:ribosomal protein S18 acetylase RimI-like enzyme
MQENSLNSQNHIRNIEYNDLPRVAVIHLAAFKTSALSMLGRETTRRYYDWLLNGPHQGIAIGCGRQGSLVGFCFAGCYRGALAGFLQKNRAFLIWKLITHPWLLSNPIFTDRFMLGWKITNLQLRKVSPPQPVHAPQSNSIPGSEHNFGVLSIAIYPQYQGLGIGKALMDYTEDIGRARGCQTIWLTVHIDNRQAIQFYERQGWQKVPHNQDWQGLMSKSLHS